MLIAIAEPEPQQVRAVPGRHDRLKIAFELLVGVGFGEHRVAVGERHRATLRIAGGELDTYGSAGVAPVGGDVFDPERGERFGERVRKVLDARLRHCELVRQSEPGRVEREAGETLAENWQQGSHHFGGAGRGMQHRQSWPAAGAQIMHAAFSDRDEVFGDLHQ